MKLVVGLGNPGEKYEKTRHNIGFRVLDSLGLDFSFEKKFNAEMAKDKDVLYCKPRTFMNNSGEAVRKAMDYFEMQPTDVILIYDDKDIVFGTVRLRSEGSAAGHNGVQSVFDHVSQDPLRVRVGIANEEMPQYEDKADFVLGRFSADEEKKLTAVIDAAKKGLTELLEDGLDKTTHRDITI